MGMWKIAGVGMALCLVACGGAAPARPSRVWVEESEDLPYGTRPFAMAASADELLRTPLGSYNEPLDVTGIVLSAGIRRHHQTLALSAPAFRATHELALRVGDERVVFQYDAPAEGAPVTPGEEVRVVAHSMRVGMRLAFSLAVLDADGAPRMIGVRVLDTESALLPAGWSIEPGPALDYACARGFLVRGPAGEILAEPGRSAVAALGAGGSRYAVDLLVSPLDSSSCADPEGEVSLVVRRVDPPASHHGSRASL